jgi:hypothetical protein
VAFDDAGELVRDHRGPTGRSNTLWTEGVRTLYHEFSGMTAPNPSAFDIWTFVALFDWVEIETQSWMKSPMNHGLLQIVAVETVRLLAIWYLLAAITSP